MTNEERIYELIESAYSLAVTATNRITELKQENSELKKRVAELENPKKKHKFRTVTIEEYCAKEHCGKCEYHYEDFYCDYSDYNKVNRGQDKKKPYKTKDGKYIFIEVKE